MGLHGVPLSMSLLGFGMRTMVANFHMGYYVGVKSSFSILSPHITKVTDHTRDGK